MPNKPPRNKRPRGLKSRPASANELLRRGNRGASVQNAMNQGSGELAALRGHIVAQLPEPLGTRVVTVIVKPGEVVIFTDSAAWAARLKIALADTPLVLVPPLSGEHRVTVKVMPTGQFRR